MSAATGRTRSQPIELGLGRCSGGRRCSICSVFCCLSSLALGAFGRFVSRILVRTLATVTVSATVALAGCFGSSLFGSFSGLVGGVFVAVVNRGNRGRRSSRGNGGDRGGLRARDAWGAEGYAYCAAKGEASHKSNCCNTMFHKEYLSKFGTRTGCPPVLHSTRAL